MVCLNYSAPSPHSLLRFPSMDQIHVYPSENIPRSLLWMHARGELFQTHHLPKHHPASIISLQMPYLLFLLLYENADSPTTTLLRVSTPPLLLLPRSLYNRLQNSPH